MGLQNSYNIVTNPYFESWIIECFQ